MSGDEDNKALEVKTATAHQYATTTDATTGRRLGTDCDAAYEVIFNESGAVIGQLVGSGVKSNIAAKICIPVNQDIKQFTEYDTYDFATE